MSEQTKLETLQIVNAGLQATLTQRNQRIAQLEEELKDARSVAAGSKEFKKAYKSGWQDALHNIHAEIDSTARALGNLSKSALNAYNEERRK